MFDSLNAVAEQFFNEIRAVGMRRHGDFQQLGGVEDGRQFVVHEVCVLRVVVRREKSAGCHDFNEVGAEFHLVTNRADEIVRPAAVCRKQGLHVFHMYRVVAQHLGHVAVAADRAQHVGGHDHPRTRDVALLDGAFGVEHIIFVEPSERAHCGKTGFEHSRNAVRRRQAAVTVGILERVAIPVMPVEK